MEEDVRRGGAIGAVEGTVVGVDKDRELVGGQAGGVFMVAHWPL